MFFTCLLRISIKSEKFININELKEQAIMFKDFDLISHCEKYRNFTKFPGTDILWKGTVSA